jgi:hypothetical protein
MPPKFVAYTKSDGGGTADRWIWWMDVVDMGGSEGVKNELCIGTGGVFDSWTRCYLYNSTSKWYDENYTLQIADADSFEGQACDLNGDGKAELVNWFYSSGVWRVIHNYTETAPVVYSFGGGLGSDTMHCEDINGDGKNDSLAVNEAGVFKYLYWNATANDYQVSEALTGGIWTATTLFRGDLSYYWDWDGDGDSELLIWSVWQTPNLYNITNFNATSFVNISQVSQISSWLARGGGRINSLSSLPSVIANAQGITSYIGTGWKGAIYYNISTSETFFIGDASTVNDDYALDGVVDLYGNGYVQVQYQQRSRTSTQGVKWIMALDFSQMGGYEDLNITWNTPANNSFTFNLSSILWNVTIGDTPNTCILNINGTTNYTMLISGNYCYYTTSNLTNQTTYCGLVYANNSLANVSGVQCATINLTGYVPPAEELTGMALMLSDVGTGLGMFLDALANPLIGIVLGLGLVGGILAIIYGFGSAIRKTFGGGM